MEPEKFKYAYGLVALLAIVALVYFGSQNISGEATILAVEQCEDSDGGDNIYAMGVCVDDYGSIEDRCGPASVDGIVHTLREHKCDNTWTHCIESSERCPDGYTCKIGACVAV